MVLAFAFFNVTSVIMLLWLSFVLERKPEKGPLGVIIIYVVTECDLD